MIRNTTMAALAVCLLWPAASVTQESPRTRVRTQPRVRVETRGGPFGVYTFNDNRGRIGVIVDMKADASGDKVGARIKGLHPVARPKTPASKRATSSRASTAPRSPA